MSRCFPYPPPGYSLGSDRNDALIESFKLQKEQQWKKEKRREKKEKRKERRERRKDKKDKKNPNSDKSDIVKGQIGQEIRSDPNDVFPQKRRGEAESEQFEHSSLTEEHGRPDSLLDPSSSYDSTENSNKRKRHSSTITGSHGHGKAILIRLPSKMQSNCHALANGQQLCLISGHTETCNVVQGFNLRNNGEEICSTSGQIEAVYRGKTGLRSTSNAVANPMQAVELQYKNLLENWFPPQLQDASLYPGDSDWLFQDRRKNQDERGEKRRRCRSDSMSCSRSSALWPRAEYLHEIDAYALPLVVPY